jgi:phosphonoacetaldehyde hydrolase
MCYLNAIQLQVRPFAAMVKIGDTISDILEGLNAGMWTIGLTQSGNELGMTEAEVNALERADLDQRLKGIEARYREAGAHYVARGIWDVLPLVDEIGERLREGECP